jgi:hypothetical protein
MLSLYSLISESKRVILSDKTLEYLTNAVNLIFKKRKLFNKVTRITSLPITIEDGTKGKVKIIVDPFLDSYGLIDSDPEDSTDPNDFVVMINPKKIKSKKGLYQTIFHELMHATDPNFSIIQNEKYWESYDSNDDEKYFGHDVEFRAYTNEFLEGLVNEFKNKRKKLKNPNSISQLKNSNKNILNYFAKDEPLNSFSEKILQSMYGDSEMEIGLRRTLDNIFKNYGDIESFRSNKYNKIDYLDILNVIKKYNPESWNRFLTSLYNTSKEIDDFL